LSLVVAAVFVDATTQDELALMAVRDSKKFQTVVSLNLARYQDDRPHS
jgi:ribonuclease HIII